MGKKHLRHTWYFKRCCSSVSHSNLKSVKQAPKARVWAYTHRYCKPSSGTPTLTRDEDSGYPCQSPHVPTGLDSRFHPAHPPTTPRHDPFLDGFFQGTLSTDSLEGLGFTASAGREQLPVFGMFSLWPWNCWHGAPPGPEEMSGAGWVQQELVGWWQGWHRLDGRCFSTAMGGGVGIVLSG